MMQLKVLPPSSTEAFWTFWFAEATAWWWNDYINWHIPWIFVPLVILFSVALCIGMMVFMMRGGRGGAQQLRGHSQRALCPWRDNESRI